ncbi:MAG: hypothetical protein V1690_01610 [Candidatus Moraniibacteriota bacterium]
MQKNKNKKLRFAVGSALVGVFAMKLLAIGLGSLVASFYLPSSVAQAVLINKTIPSDFHYQTNTLTNLRALNLSTYVGKPVKIAFDSKNPDGLPGQDQDLLILFPPRFLNENTSVPLRTLYFSSGKSIDSESADFVRNSQQFVDSIAANNPALLEILKNLLESNLKISIKDDRGLVTLLINQVKAEGVENASVLDSTALLNSLLAADDGSVLPSNLDTSDPQVKQLLVILLLLIIMNQSLAKSLNADKDRCIEGDGEWTNNQCVNDRTAACEENGGLWKKFDNQCLSDKAFCGNEDLSCTSETSNAETLWGCVCKAGSCLDDNGLCAEQDNGKKRLCENSGGTWRDFFDASELCLQKCGATEAACSSALNQTVQGSAFSSSSSSSFKGCDCSTATTDSSSKNWSGTGTGTSTGKCLAPTGKCIAKDTSSSDDDNDGVPNGQDRCPGSSPDGSGTVNKNLGSADAGCTCSQLQGMNRIQKPQCPPDGCENGTEYMVTYDRNSQNNTGALCQNGIIQQQQNATCPVISRTPTQQCMDLADRMKNNQNRNGNDNMSDLLKKLMDDKKKQDQKDKNKGKDQQQQQNNGGQQQPPGQQPQQPDQKKKEEEEKKKKEEEREKEKAKEPPTATTPDIGEYNKNREGSQAIPYGLHPSQFKKVCGENTYVLVNATQAGKKFKNETKAQTATGTPGTLGVPDLNKEISKIGSCPGGCDPSLSQKSKPVQQLLNNNWHKLDQSQQQSIQSMLGGGQITVTMLNQINNNVNQFLKDNFSKNKTSATSASPAADTMKDLKNKDGTGPNNGEIYFKAPKCEELAAAHCCVCSCCDPKKKDCGWAISKTCKDGKCEGQKCTGNSCEKCHEIPEKSIQLDMGQISDIFKCNNLNNDKVGTARKLCENYNDSTHQGICRYDCSAKTEGCESERQDCKIIINLGDNSSHLEFNRKEKDGLGGPKPGSKHVELINRADGSLLKAMDGVNSKWIQKLSSEGGKACKCNGRDENNLVDKNEDGGDGISKPSDVTPQPQQPPGQKPQAGEDNPYYQGDKSYPSQTKPTITNPYYDPVTKTWKQIPDSEKTGPITPDQKEALIREQGMDFINYENEKKSKDLAWGEYKQYQNYVKDIGWYRRSDTLSWLGITNKVTFEQYKQGKR